MKTTIDTIAAEELYLFADNDYSTYARFAQPLLKNMGRKLAKGIFDPDKAVKAFEYATTYAAKRYCEEFGGVYHQVFNAATRREAARMLMESFMDNIASVHPF